MNQLTLFNQDYYNTVGLSGQELFERVNNAKSLNDKVLEIVKHHNKALTWSEWILHVENAVQKQVNEVSLKRALSVNFDKGLIGKTHGGITRKSKYGAPAHLYGTFEAVTKENDLFNKTIWKQ